MIKSYEEFVKNYKDELEELLNDEAVLDEFIIDTVDAEIDVYTTDLLDWYREDLNRLYFIDDFLKECGCDGQTIFNLLQVGQYEYLREKIQEWTNKYISEKKKESF